MKLTIVIAVILACSTGVLVGCRSSSSGAAASSVPVALTPPVKNTARMTHIVARNFKQPGSTEYNLDLSGVDPALYAKELEFYTENALKFDHPNTSSCFKPMTRNDAGAAITVKVSFRLTQGATGRRGTRYRAVYAIEALEKDVQLWRVESSCESQISDLTIVNSWLAGLVATARMYIGQEKVMPMQSAMKYPEFLNAVYGRAL